MARGYKPRRAGGGGGGIPAARPGGARVASAFSALAGCAALAAYPAATAEHFPQLVAVPGAFALGVLGAAVLLGWPAGIAWALALLGTAYASALAAAEGAAAVDAVAPLYAGGLLLVAELSYWSLELRGSRREDPGAMLRRLVALSALAALSVAIGGFVVLVTAAPAGGGLAWDAIGIGAIAATLAIVATLARRGAQR